jgi:hypothetical protein
MKDLQDLREPLRNRTNIKETIWTIARLLSERKAFWTIRRHSLGSPNHLSRLFPDARHDPPLSLFLRATVRAFPAIAHEGQYTTSLGIDPMLAMGAGIPCLIVSIICFAYYSQPGHIWQSCVAITILAAIGMPLALLYDHEGVAFVSYITGSPNESFYWQLEDGACCSACWIRTQKSILSSQRPKVTGMKWQIPSFRETSLFIYRRNMGTCMLLFSRPSHPPSVSPVKIPLTRSFCRLSYSSVATAGHEMLSSGLCSRLSRLSATIEVGITDQLKDQMPVVLL